MHPSTKELLGFFDYIKHLPPPLARASERFHDLAHEVARGHSCAETTVALRKLLEARDAAVRAVVLSIKASKTPEEFSERLSGIVIRDDEIEGDKP